MIISKLTLHITFSSNNIHAQLRNIQNEALASCSSGQLKFKGTTKKSLVAAETIAIWMAGKIIDLKKPIKDFYISVHGVSNFKAGFKRKLLSFSLPTDYFNIKELPNFTGPHNGCKLPKKRRK